MFLPSLFTVNAILCVAAFGFAALVRSGRREAITLAGLLCVNFVFCNLAYTDYAPKLAFQAAGMDVSSKDLWFCADALFGMACIMAYDRWWGWGLWFSSGVQLGIHMAYEASAFSPETYSDMLQDVLLAQLAVFFLIGGRGAKDLLLDIVDRFSGGGRHVEAPLHSAADEADK